MGNVTIDAGDRATGAGPDAAPHLGWVVAGCSAAAAVIHFAMVPVHAGSGLTDPLGFAVVGWFQLIVAGMILANRGTKRLYAVTVLGNLAVIGLWILSRTVGLPIGAHKGIVEQVAAIDLLCAVLEGVAVVVAIRIVLAGEQRVGRIAPALAAIAALGLATTVITSPDAASHSHGATVDATTALESQIDSTRCDQDLNLPAYWKEAKTLGIDTYQGGNLPSAAPAAAAPVDESQPHTHTAGAAVATGGTTTTTSPDPTQGRGSAVVDELGADVAQAAGGEGAAAKLITDLAKASDTDYKDFLWWLRASGNIAHAHTGTTAAAGDGTGHGGHVGPQLWTALTDQKQCARLHSELTEARKAAMALPTVADAKKAGYTLVTGYVPGIAAHYINYSYIDGTLEIDKPEMILYDGTSPDAHVVGLSYYLIHEGGVEPTQGFTGFNDHGHQHVGLCQGNKGQGVIGDSTLTAEECAARGGTKDNNSAGWMYHAWVVPGCESPWGVFSAASPILDYGVAAGSGKDGGHCASSQVRKRYGMKPTPGTHPVKYDPKAFADRFKGRRRGGNGGRPGSQGQGDAAATKKAVDADVGATPEDEAAAKADQTASKADPAEGPKALKGN